VKKSLFLLIFVLSTTARSAIIDRVSAVVGEEPILQSDILGLRKEVASSQALASILKIDAAKMSDRDLLNRLIEEKIIKQALRDLDLVVSDADVEKQVDDIAKQNRLSKSQLEDQLERENISPAAYRRSLRSQIERRNIFERELRRGGGVTEQETRALYEQKAPKELKLWLVTGPEAELKKLGLRKNVDAAKLKAPLHANEIGWVAAASLDERLVEAAQKSVAGEALGPIKSGKQTQVFVVEEVRKGSEEEFQRMRNELNSAAQAKDFESRFNYWLEQKRREMQIIINVETKG